MGNLQNHTKGSGGGAKITPVAAAAGDKNLLKNCNFCNKKGHGQFPKKEIREKQCGAWGITYYTCEEKNHMSYCCKKRPDKKAGKKSSGKKGDPKKDAKSDADQQQGGIDQKEPTDDDGNNTTSGITVLDYVTICPIITFNNEEDDNMTPVDDMFNRISVCTLKTVEGQAPDKMIPHMMRSTKLGKFIEQRARPHPKTNVSFRLYGPAYKQIGYVAPFSAKGEEGCSIDAVTDTGAMSVCAGPNLMYGLGLRECDLFPVTARLTGAGSTKLDVIGGLFAELTAWDPTDGQMYQSFQICYIIKGCTDIYISHSCLIDFCIVDPNYPVIGRAHKIAITIDHLVNNNPTFVEEKVPIEKMYGEEEVSGECQTNADGKCSCQARQDTPDPPKKLPFLATKENKEKLKLWIINYYKPNAFNVYKNQKLPIVTAPPMKILLKEDAEHYAIHRPVPVPICLCDKVKSELDRDVAMGIIEPVPPNTPVVWCTRMVIVPKKSGEHRRTVDLQKLNKNTIRKTHHTESPFHLASQCPENYLKSVLDVYSSYHLVLLLGEDKDLTTFITSWGYYKYLKGVQGDKSAGDAWTHRNDNVTKDVENKATCVDNTCLWEKTIEEYFFQVCNCLSLCGQNGIVFNKKKC